MPKKKATQPELIREERAEYKISPEEQARKDEYRARLKKFLEDPASRQIEGFPIGEVDDILALSDPPYYTACPNPFLSEIIQQWTEEREANRKSEIQNRKYHREPFAADVSEGKNDPIYNAHSYHTKVPHKAIMRYILHYTEPRDIVFDGFCGTGMTGVAAQLCGDKKTVESLGYQVTDDGKIYEGDKLISQLGARKAVLNDLSPAATFIAYNYNTPVDILAFEREAKRILEEVEQECGWMYETNHADEKTKGSINYVIWSDVFGCPECGKEMVFWDVAVDQRKGKVRDTWKCPSCKTDLAKNPKKGTGALRVERTWDTFFDPVLHKTVKIAKQEPVLINYSVGKRRFEKKPSKNDLRLIQKVQEIPIAYSIPVERMPSGDESRRNDDIGITHIHHFFTRRNLIVLSALWEKGETNLFRWIVSGIMQRACKQHQIAISRVASDHKIEGGKTAGHRRGTLYIPSNQVEFSVFELFDERLRSVLKAKRDFEASETVVISNQSSTKMLIPDNSIEYLFVDPPFGANIMYSELNFIWEAWLKVFTNNTEETIVNKHQQKKLLDYQRLMEASFGEFYRLLKAGHWITIEFHNTLNIVWTAIQEALISAGFVVADVRTLDKQKKTHTQVTATGSVNQDLVITAYKPNDNLEERFRLEAGTVDGAWDFIRYHLTQLPRVVEKNGEIEVVGERQGYLLFDRMVAFHIQRGASVPLSAGEFYAGLKQKFVERDGMYFLPDQVAEYDAARLRLGRVAQLALFVSDEKSAIQWLRQQLDPALGGEPQTFAELQPKFMRGSNPAKHEQMPELGVILEQNFLEDKDGNWYAPDPSKATDLERLRLKALLREFDEYVKSTGRLKQFRTEAVRAGFAEAYKKREYKVILEVAGRLPESVLHEDPDLLMYFDTATLRTGQ